jgi:hypothetical protein
MELFRGRARAGAAVIAVLASMLGGQAAAASGTLRDKRLAVLEFEAPWKVRCEALRATGKHAELELDDRCKALDVLTDAARTAATDQMSRAGMTLFTRANTMEILREQGICNVEDGDCALETGRSLGVQFLMVGKVSELEGLYIVDLHIYDVATGAVLPGANQVEGKGLLDAARAVRELVPKAIERGLGIGIPGKPSPAVQGAVPWVIVTMKVEPPEAEAEVDGKVVTAGKPLAFGPGKHRAVTRAKGYLPDERDFTLDYGQDPLVIGVTLARVPRLTVATTPPGAALRIDGRDFGKTDTSVVLDPGSHDLELELAGFENVKRTMKLAPGQEERLSIALVRGLSAQDRGSRRRWAWGFTAAAAAGLAVSAWQGLDAKAHDVKAGDLLAGTPAAKTNASDQKRAMLLADAGMVVGLLAAVPAGILWWKLEF